MSAFYWLAQRHSGSGSLRRVPRNPTGTGLGNRYFSEPEPCELQGLFRHDTTFVRTPKAGDQVQKIYSLPSSRALCSSVEWHCTLCSRIHWLSQWASGTRFPFMLLFAMGYGYVGLQSWRQPKPLRASLSLARWSGGRWEPDARRHTLAQASCAQTSKSGDQIGSPDCATVSMGIGVSQGSGGRL